MGSVWGTREHMFVSGQIEILLQHGLSRAEVARRLGVSASTVSKWAIRGGFGRRDRPTTYDWAAISALYDHGASVADCQRQFGFSDGAWEAAVCRGDVAPRPQSASSRAHPRRDRVRELYREGRSAAAIASELGITRSTVSYHLRRLGVPADRRFARRVDWTAVNRAHQAGASVRECMKLFGFSRSSWHDAVLREDVRLRDPRRPIDELLRSTPSRGHLKRRLFRAGLKQARCERCGLDRWRGQVLGLCLHHVNGNGSDNRLENLEILCPNCHSQTENFAGRNRGGNREPRVLPSRCYGGARA